MRSKSDYRNDDAAGLSDIIRPSRVNIKTNACCSGPEPGTAVVQAVLNQERFNRQ